MWNQPHVDVNERFLQASQMCGSEFDNKVLYFALAWLPARQLVVDALSSRCESHPSGFHDHFVPLKSHLFGLEQEFGMDASSPLTQPPLYVVYRDDFGGQWRVQCVPQDQDSFVSRKPLPEPWRGLRDETLSGVTGIPDCVFVHASGFIGGNRTKEGAMEMAALAELL